MAEQYKCTLTYAAVGAGLGKLLNVPTPSPRISSAVFWGLMGAAVGYAKDSGNTNENPKRGDNPTFNYTEGYQGIAG